jgi:hypothetical protein
MAARIVSDDFTGLIHHSDHGANQTNWSIRNRIVKPDGAPPVESKGDSYDKA